MTRPIMTCIPFLILSQIADGQELLMKAADKYISGITWRAKSVVIGDFTCSGHQQQAILGTNATEIVVAVFINGMQRRPEVLRYLARVRDPILTRLKVENLDFDPKEDLGYDLPGFQRSKICKGINLSDERTDSAHIYWNHEAHRFDDWSH
jgi:hypothetical protein